MAYTYAGLVDLLPTYERLAKQGIEPYWCINHGPTTSLYSKDPDGNGVELQVENFAAARSWKRSLPAAPSPRTRSG